MAGKAPFVGAVYESARDRDPAKLGERWRWKVVGEQPGDIWELARIGGNRTRRGNLLRTGSELRDEKKWRLLESESSAQEQLLPGGAGQ